MIPFGWAEGDIDDDGVDAFPAAWTSRAAAPRWDVDTLVSTYSNADNHPRRLDDGVSLTSARRVGLGPRALDASGAAAAAAGASASAGAGAGGPELITAGLAQMRLSRKTGLPLRPQPQPPAAALPGSGGGSGGGGGGEEAAASVAAVAAPGAGAGAESVDDDDGEGEAGGGGGGGGNAPGAAWRRGETAEERRARKALVKAERRANRADKKDLKLAYKAEILRQTALAAKADAVGRGAVIVS